MNQPSEKAKMRAIIAHITIVGWIIALVMNTEKDKEEFASFYIRQMLGIVLLGVVFSSVIISMGTVIPLIGAVLSLVPVLLWMYSLVGAVQGKKTPLPLVGNYFQDWFKSIS